MSVRGEQFVYGLVFGSGFSIALVVVGGICKALVEKF